MASITDLDLRLGDCLDVLPTLEADSVDTCITDPPAGINFMGKEWDSSKGGRDAWITWMTKVMSECYRVIKPGGFAIVWGIPRTSHWTATAIENAGFEICDKIYHLFGSGFPKGHRVSRVYQIERHGSRMGAIANDMMGPDKMPQRLKWYRHEKEWTGWNPALKPAAEEWIVAMKPIEGTFAENALKWGVAGINVDGARIPTNGNESLRGGMNSPNYQNSVHEGWDRPWRNDKEHMARAREKSNKRQEYAEQHGRWPANVILDEAAAAALDEMSGESVSRQAQTSAGFRSDAPVYGDGRPVPSVTGANDSGGASRYFKVIDRFAYVPKASRSERNEGLEGMERKPQRSHMNTHNGTSERFDGAPTPQSANFHPTVKPIELLRYLARLTKTPTGGVILDPFMGSGSMGIAAFLEGRSFIGIELDPDYYEIAERRIRHWRRKGRQLKLWEPVYVS